MASQKRAARSPGQARSGGAATKAGQRQGDRPGQRQDGRARQPQDSRSQNGQSQNGRQQNGGAANRARQGRPDSRGRAVLTAEPAATAAGTGFSAPPWLQWSTLALSLAGLGMSVYMTIAHYTSPSILVCSSKGFIDCAKVTTSPESMVFSVFPVAVLGLVFYVFMTAINTPWAWRSGIPAIWWARLGGIITGIGFVLYLIYAEIIQIGNICLDCTTVHLITFLLFALLIFAATLRSGQTAKAAR
jgi:uncharacterized membrane protein